MKPTANLVFFARICDERFENSTVNLAETTRRQIQLVKEFGLPATWLLQYDTHQNTDLV